MENFSQKAIILTRIILHKEDSIRNKALAH